MDGENAIALHKTLVCKSVKENFREHILLGNIEKSPVLQGLAETCTSIPEDKDLIIVDQENTRRN